MKRRFSARLMAATVERLRPIGLSRNEAQRLRRAEDRDDRPVWPRKDQCPGCVAARAADSENRWPVGWCGRRLPAARRSESIGMKPRLLDLFCKAGGATRGYQRAGFYVVGVDIEPQPNYVGDEFHQADAMAMVQDRSEGCWHEGVGTSLPGRLAACLGHFDAVHASPPCQDHTCLNNGGINHGTGWMLAATIERLSATGLPWVVENVPGPSSRGHHFTLCGSAFGLGVRRHRRFWSSVGIMAPPCAHQLQPRPIDVTGNGRGSKQRLIDRGRNSPLVTQADRREAMGIDWMNRDELSQAIPPAYTEWIGAQLLAALEAAA